MGTRSLRLGVPLVALGLLSAACPTRGSLMPPEGTDDGGTDPNDMPVVPPTDRGFIEVDGMLVPVDGGDPPPVDSGPRPDVPDTRPACTPYVAPTRTDPCAGRPDCGLPSHGSVAITGATGPLTNLQVRVELPMAVRTAIGATCDRLVFRTATNEWAPHFVTDCAMGIVWVRAPTIAAGTTTLTMHYGGATAVPAAQSYDDTFDRVPYQAANLVGAYTFDEGTGSRTCPVGGPAAVPFDAYILQTPYDSPPVDVATRPPLWSDDAPPSLLNSAGRFTRNQHSLNFPSVPVLKASGLSSPNRVLNWRSTTSAPFNTAREQLTVGVWVNPTTASNHFNDNFQTVVCFGMPNQTARAEFWRLPETDPHIVNNAIFNPWAIFFRGDGEDDTLYQGNSCVEPCTDVMQYAHITTTQPLAGAAFVNHWHFLAFTLDTTQRPHTIRRSYYDGNAYDYPQQLDLFPPGGRYCPANPAVPMSQPLVAPCYPGDLPDGGAGTPTCWQACPYLCPGTVDGMQGPNTCVYPPEAPIQYPPAPVVIGADMNDGEAQLGINGTVDDLFIIGRAISPDEMAAYRERRQYTAMPIRTAVTP